MAHLNECSTSDSCRQITKRWECIYCARSAWVPIWDCARGWRWHWQFFADPRFPFYRLTYRHNFSDRFPPCLVAEVTDRGQPLPVREIVAALETIGIKPEWVAETREERLEFTYPIPTLRSEAEKPAVIAAF